jgi:putative sugar O-methyltransferase
MTYDAYSDYVRSICNANDFSVFKSNPNYTYMLEHVLKEQGKNYLDCIFSLTSITKEEVIEFCSLNDAIGNPNKETYEELNFCVSPTSLRYIFHAHLILTHMKNINESHANIIELGGGYGGLCLSVYHFASKYGVSINSYTICDLPSIIRLQKIYINTINPARNVEFVDATTFGMNIEYRNMFLISNYCFSEISRENQNSYIKWLFPKISHGFMAWNAIHVYDFGFTIREEPEIPNTGGDMNRYIYF